MHTVDFIPLGDVRFVARMLRKGKYRNVDWCRAMLVWSTKKNCWVASNQLPVAPDLVLKSKLTAEGRDKFRKEWEEIYKGTNILQGTVGTVAGVWKPWGEWGKPVFVPDSQWDQAIVAQMRKRREFAERCWKDKQKKKSQWVRLGLLVGVIGLFVALCLDK